MVLYHSHCEFIVEDSNVHEYEEILNYIDSLFTEEYLCKFNDDFMFLEKLSKNLYFSACIHEHELYLAIYRQNTLFNFISSELISAKRLHRVITMVYNRFDWGYADRNTFIDPPLKNMWNSMLYDYTSYTQTVLCNFFSFNEDYSLKIISNLTESMLNAHFIYDIIIKVKNDEYCKKEVLKYCHSNNDAYIISLEFTESMKLQYSLNYEDAYVKAYCVLKYKGKI